MGNTPSGFTAPALPRSRSPVLRAERRRPNAEGLKCEVRSAGCPDGKGRVGSDAGRQANARRVGSTQRREVRQAAAHKEFLCGVAYLAALREIRLPSPHFRGGTPIGGRRPLGNTPSGFTAPVLPCSRAPVLRARRGAPHFVRVLKYGAASRPPALPRSRPPVLRAERRRPNAEGRRVVRSAKCGLPRWQGPCRIGRWQAGECTAGWFHAKTRSTPSRRPQRIPLRRGVLGALA